MLLAVRGFGVAYGEHAVLRGVNCTLERGETLAVIGPSGCGKSTLLNSVAGLLRRYEGEITLAAGCRTAFIMQDYGLFPWKTVGENLALPLQLAGIPPAERRAATGRMLEELGLAGMEGRYPLQLSGGQRQRIAIGRALIARPDLLLMDEPFAALDALTRERLQEQMLAMCAKRGTAVMLVTHSSAEAVFLGSRVMVLGGLPAVTVDYWENPCCGLREGWGVEAQLHRVRRALALRNT